MLKWEWYTDANTMRLFIHCLLRANWKDGTFKGVKILRGSFVSGRKELAHELRLTEQQIRTAILHLQSTNEITIKTYPKFSVITVNNYDRYQVINQQNDQELNQQTTNNQPPDNQQITTIEEIKNIKKEIKEEYIPPIIPQRGKSKSAVATKEELEALLNETAFSDYLKDSIKGWLVYKREKGQSYKPMGFKQLLTKITNQLSIETEDMIVKDIEECMSRNYAGIFFGTAQKTANKGQQSTQDWIKMWEEA